MNTVTEIYQHRQFCSFSAAFCRYHRGGCGIPHLCAVVLAMYCHNRSNILGTKLEVGDRFCSIQHGHSMALGMGRLPHNTITNVDYGVAEYRGSSNSDRCGSNHRA